jgi:hypothetical protein
MLASTWSVRSHADGAYGRIQGDVALQLEAGSGFDDRHPPLLGHVTARYLQTAGVYTTWILHPRHASERPSTASFGLELRPLFLPRFLENRQAGPAVFDMLVDSLSLRLGTVTASKGPFSSPSPGFESGLALGIPVTSRAEGPWLGTSAALRWPHHAIGGHGDPSLLWTITLGWQTFFRSGLVDLRDGRTR